MTSQVRDEYRKGMITGEGLGRLEELQRGDAKLTQVGLWLKALERRPESQRVENSLGRIISEIEDMIFQDSGYFTQLRDALDQLEAKGVTLHFDNVKSWPAVFMREGRTLMGPAGVGQLLGTAILLLEMLGDIHS